MGLLGEIGLLGGEIAELAGNHVPGLSTLVHGAQSLYHGGAAGIDMMFGDAKGARKHATEAGFHAIESIPFLGSGFGITKALGDMDAKSKGTETYEEHWDKKLFGEPESNTKTYGGKEADMKLHPENYTWWEKHNPFRTFGL